MDGLRSARLFAMVQVRSEETLVEKQMDECRASQDVKLRGIEGENRGLSERSVIDDLCNCIDGDTPHRRRQHWARTRYGKDHE